MTRHRAYVMENLDTGQAVCAGVSRGCPGYVEVSRPSIEYPASKLSYFRETRVTRPNRRACSQAIN